MIFASMFTVHTKQLKNKCDIHRLEDILRVLYQTLRRRQQHVDINVNDFLSTALYIAAGVGLSTLKKREIVSILHAQCMRYVTWPKDDRLLLELFPNSTRTFIDVTLCQPVY